MKIFDRFLKKESKDGLIIDDINNIDDFEKDDVFDKPIRFTNKEDVNVPKPKKLPIEDLKDRVSELEKILQEANFDNPNIENKTSKLKLIPIFVSGLLLGNLSMGYVAYTYLNQQEESILTVANTVKNIKVGIDVNKQETGNTDVKILSDKINKLNEDNKLVTLKFTEIEKKILEVVAKSGVNDGKNKVDEMMKKYDEANALMAEVVTKQKMEIVSLNKKVEDLLIESKNKIGLSKDDLGKLAMLETSTLKNRDVVEVLSKDFSKFVEEYNNSKLVTLNSKKPNEKGLSDADLEVSIASTISKNSNNQTGKKDLPIFTVYKVTSDKNFYLKNRINGKILESAISVKDVIINRYEVLDIDSANKSVIFKDHETGASLTLSEGQ